MYKYLGSYKVTGFTLIELIAVLLIVAIVGAIGSNFLVTTVDGYSRAKEQADLIFRGRLAIEQMTRRMRIALPNSARVSASGDCIEFLPVVAGVNYLDYVADAENGAPAVSTINTAPFALGLGSAVHVSIAPLFPSEIYSISSTASRVGIGTLGSSPYTSVPLSSAHRFVRNSPNKRLYVTDNPIRFCISGTTLVEYSSFGLPTTSLTDADPGGSSSLLASNVTSNGTAFSLSPGSEDRNSAIVISLNFLGQGVQVALTNTVLVRNVP